MKNTLISSLSGLNIWKLFAEYFHPCCKILIISDYFEALMSMIIDVQLLYYFTEGYF